MPPLNQHVHPPAVKPGQPVANVYLSGIFLTSDINLLLNPHAQANMSISFEKNISLCLKSDTKIVHFKVNFVFLQAKHQNYALSLTIPL